MYCPSEKSVRVSLISFVALLAVALCLFVFAPAVTFAQSSNTGTVSGTVVDPSNAIVPGASITLVNTATLATRSTLSNKEGQYVFAFVDPGDYSIKVSKTGFKTTVVANQGVKIGLQTTVNITLQVGATSTTVEVTSTPGAELQTLNPTVGATIPSTVVMNLPNQTRDASTLAVLQPGQNINGNTGGLASDQNSFQLDGGYATDDMSGDDNTYIRGFASDTAGGTGAFHSAGFAQAPSGVVPMPVSSIQEFKVSTANQTADFNGGGGSQMQAITKRGTDKFHGTVYEYYLDNNFGGANTWDNNSTGTKQPSSHFSRFGAAGGGKIPKVNFLGGSWFIFDNYEGFRFPASSTFERNFPLPSLRAGIIHVTGSDAVNLNPNNVVDPGCGNTTCDITTGGQTIAPSGLDPLNLGLNPVICTPTSGSPDGTCGAQSNGNPSLWSMIPLPNDCTHGDGLNYCGFKGNVSTPQTSNFNVARIDHDFNSKWHFNGTYHYYKLKNTVSDQWDIGGFFPGDKAGQYAAIRSKPQDNWIYTAGLTTDINANMTNTFNYSYTRNWWAYGDPSGVPNIAGFPAALEVGGETSNPFGPYNTNNQSTRTRYWNGHDSMFRDDVTWIKGNHLFQFGGSYLRANDTHNRNDNGESINTFEQYLVGAGNGASLSGFGITGLSSPSGISSRKFGNLYSMVLGMVDESQGLFTRGLGSAATGLPLLPQSSCAIQGIAATADCLGSPSLTNNSIIPTYNVYFTDSWHLKPTFSVNYGIGYTIEMPPYETRGGEQSVMVDGSGALLSVQKYLDNEKQAALQGLAYAPFIGFEAIRNVQHHSKYPYDPYYLGLSPRIGFAWNVRPDTVVRGGYARIFGRINGVNPILVPMLTPGLMQPDTCGGPNVSGGCGGDVSSIVRVGNPSGSFDGFNAPLPKPSANLPQPWFPGGNDVAVGSAETFDPNFHPDRSDEFTFSVQHQFGPKILVEGGYIGRILRNEVQYYSLTNVPYMMTQGGQTFANAWAATMLKTNYTTGVNTAFPVAGTPKAPGPDFSSISAQPFFESAINPAYLATINGEISSFNTKNAAVTGFVPLNQCSNLTCAFLTAEGGGPLGTGNMVISDPFDAWGDFSNSGLFTFGRSFTSDPIPSTCLGLPTDIGCNGQTPSMITTASNGYGNYNAGYLQATFSNWHGLTMKSNFQWSNALGTGDVVQASSSFSSVDNFNIHNNYGPQTYNEKFVFNMFMSYSPTYYASQDGVVGHLLGGWTFSPLFVWGSGFPNEMITPTFLCGTFGQCNTNFVGSLENSIIAKNLHYSATRKAAVGTNCGTAGAGFNVFSNPDAACPSLVGGAEIFGDPVRAPILGLDGQMGGGGPLYGLSFWNLDLGITKKIKIMERLSSSLFFDFTNVTNHMQPADPVYDPTDTSTWGVLGGGGNLQANQPRRFQLGISVDW